MQPTEPSQGRTGPPSLKDVTEVFQHYRLTLRELWNRSIWSEPELRWLQDIPRIFQHIKSLLFEALILERLATEDQRLAHGEEWEGRFRVVPAVESVADHCCVATLTPVVRNSGGGIIGQPLIQIRDSDVTLEYVDLFNWSNVAYLDYPLLQVRIVDFRSRPKLIGTEALIPVEQVRIVLTDDRGLAGSADAIT